MAALAARRGKIRGEILILIRAGADEGHKTAFYPSYARYVGSGFCFTAIVVTRDRKSVV